MAEIEVGKFGKKSGIDLSTFKAGLKADKLTAEQKSIFNAIDADKNGVVDEEELEKLKSGLDKNGNNTISKREAKKFLKNNDLKNLDKKEVMKFLKSYLDNTQNVEDAEVVDTAADGQKTVKISYKDGTSEVVNANFISKTDQNGNTVSKYYDDNKTLEKEKRTTSEGDSIEVQYDSDGETPVSSLENKKDGTETQIEYKEGKPVTKQVKLGTTKSNYTFDEQGNEILNIIRKDIDNDKIPIIILSAKSHLEDRISGLNNGADDYLVKPFNIKELISRINVQYRKFLKDKFIIKLKEFTLDIKNEKFYKFDNVIDLTSNEFKILKYLFLKQGNVVSRDELYNQIWGTNNKNNSRSVDMHIKSIRAKIGDENKNFIKSIYGGGYIIEK